MGPLPPHTAGPSYLTRRGKVCRRRLRLTALSADAFAPPSSQNEQRGQKHYTVFRCELQAGAREAFAPRLNYEHREARWFSPAALRAAALAGSTEPPAPLHPTVEALVHQHPASLGAA